jgi:hypothetical protein
MKYFLCTTLLAIAGVALAAPLSSQQGDQDGQDSALPDHERIQLRELLVNRAPAIDGPAVVVDPEESQMDELLVHQALAAPAPHTADSDQPDQR